MTTTIITLSAPHRHSSLFGTLQGWVSGACLCAAIGSLALTGVALHIVTQPRGAAITLDTP